MAEMLGLDKAAAAQYLIKKLPLKKLSAEAPFLCPALVDAAVNYLHACGALSDGDSADGEFDEDEAVEFMLDQLCERFDPDDQKALQYAELLNNFWPVFDDFLLISGLLSL